MPRRLPGRADVSQAWPDLFCTSSLVHGDREPSVELSREPAPPLVRQQPPQRRGDPECRRRNGTEEPAPPRGAQRSIGHRVMNVRRGVRFGEHPAEPLTRKPAHFSRAATGTQKRGRVLGFRILGGARRFLLCGLGGNAVGLGSPRAQVAEPAALAAKRPPAVRFREHGRLAARGAGHGARGGIPGPGIPPGFAHRLQKASSKGTSCSYTFVFCTPSGRRKRTFRAYLLALISGTHASSSWRASRSICAGFSAGVCW